jgi:glyoxylase-like metal-dependent hydrolase (beta-lactamase superfamily II)
MQIKIFEINPFQENTYIIADEFGECTIIDPGFYHQSERRLLDSFLDEKGWKPTQIIQTHAHLDHVFGCKYVAETYGIGLYLHKAELPVLQAATQVASMYGVACEDPPKPAGFLEEGDKISMGGKEWDIFFTPGHSPGGICFYQPEEQILICGDVLFAGSIGRTDLPGGDFNTLISSIKNKLLTLPDEVKAYPGHGPYTTIGRERLSNPFLT